MLMVILNRTFYRILISHILDAAKINYPLQERGDLTVANAVKDWLKFAKTRMSKQKDL